MEKNIAIFLRHFQYTDIEVLRSKILPGSTDEEIFKVMAQWETHDYNGLPFEMYAICANTTIVGSLSLLLCKDYSTVRPTPTIFPKFRRKGYAKEAMTQAILLLKTNKYISMSAEVTSKNVAGIRLYESLGFTQAGETVSADGQTILTYTLPL